MNATEPATLDLFERIVRSRTSIRAFLPQPVPETILRRAFEIAGRAPSNCNTQPWVTHVASGSVRDRLAETLTKCAEQDRYSPDYPYLNEQYTALYKQRQFEHGRQMFEAIGVAREDKEMRRKVVMRNMSFFGAPHVAFLFMPAFGNQREAADIGLYAQTLMLALAAAGVGSCPQTAVGLFAGPVRREFNVGDDLKFLFAISIGYEDRGHSGSRIEQARAALGEAVYFHD